MEGTRGQRAVDGRAAQVVLAAGLEEREAAMLTFDAMTQGFRVAPIAPVEQARALEAEPVLAVLGAHGFDMASILAACRGVRARFAQVPIVLILARHCPGLELQAVDAGADDVIACRLGVLHVLPRLKSLRRRADQAAKRDRLIAGQLVVDRKLRYACLGDRPLGLTRTELAILEYLMLHADRVVPIRVLMSTVLDRNVSERTIRQHVRNIRKKMNPAEPNDCPIRTLRGEGYLVDVGWTPERERERRTPELIPLAKAQTAAQPPRQADA
jgi:two-component system, OmpR family, response regulator TctD